MRSDRGSFVTVLHRLRAAFRFRGVGYIGLCGFGFWAGLLHGFATRLRTEGFRAGVSEV